MHGWGNLDEDAKRIENAETARLAVCNIDWDRITANDLFGNFYFGIIRKFKMPIHKILCRFKRKINVFDVCINIQLTIWRGRESDSSLVSHIAQPADTKLKLLEKTFS